MTVGFLALLNKRELARLATDYATHVRQYTLPNVGVDSNWVRFYRRRLARINQVRRQKGFVK